MPRLPRGRALLISIAAVTAVVLVVAALTAIANGGQSNGCRAVGELLRFNDSQMELMRSRTHIPSAGSYDEPSAPTVGDYKAWADGMKRHAAEVTEPGLTTHAQRAAELAKQSVLAIEQFRSESDTRDLLDMSLPPSAESYAQVTAELDEQMQALEEACPQRS